MIVFVDFKKAFDSVHRGRMLDILKAYDIPPRLHRAITTIYENTQSKVTTPDGETNYFEVKRGVLQGDTLAPYLFAIVIDFIMCKTYENHEIELGFKLQRRRSTRHPDVTVTDLDFADDLALITEEIEQGQEVLNRLETEAEGVGLLCNAKKTEVQVINQTPPVIITSKSGDQLKVVDNFKYLGSWIKSSENDLKVRKSMAWSACYKMRKIWNSQLSKALKIRLFVTTVESVLLYGSETWTMTATMKKRLDGCYTKMLRMVQNISWRSHTTNAELYGNLPKVSTKVQQRRMRLAGHLVRHREEIGHHLVLWQPTDGRASRGRRKKTFVDNLLEDTGASNVTELKDLMNNREDWRKRVEAKGAP